MKKIVLLIGMVVLFTTNVKAQDDHIGDGLRSIATVIGETKTADNSQDSIADVVVNDIPLWKKKLYYGYNFDIYYHNDSRSNEKTNGYSISLTPELGWRLNERMQMGLRLGGSIQDATISYSYLDFDDSKKTEDLRVLQGTWEVTPYFRYRLKTLFNDKIGVWLEGHAYTGMEFPRVTAGDFSGTDYDGLKHSVIYGAQISPVITYQFNEKSTFQIFFSILSIGYSGTTFFYQDPVMGKYTENTNDVIIFSGKLRNLIANQYTPGLYGFKLGIQKSF